MRDIALILHVLAGVVAVLFGPLAIVFTLRRRGLNWAGEVYHWAIALVCLTALVMVPYDWARLWYFWPITIGISHAHHWCGSETTAIAVQSATQPPPYPRSTPRYQSPPGASAERCPR